MNQKFQITGTHDFRFNTHSFSNKVVVVVAFAIPNISMNIQI
jgi:hypothetical protein